MFNLSYVLSRVEDISKVSESYNDGRVAHFLECMLRTEFIRYIACGGTRDIVEIAKAIGSVNAINFKRNY